MEMRFEANELYTESDVEQKLTMPLLITPSPFGLGFSTANVRTKPDIRRLPIGKGSDKKLYYPDYVVVVSGLPMMIVEAKSPEEDVESGYREARLYATELNALFPANLNPASIIICVNGKQLIAGSWDCDQPQLRLDCSQLEVTREDFAEFARYAGFAEATQRAKTLLKSMVSRPFYRPTRLLGGQSVRNEEIGNNAFGATLSLEYRHLFNPTTDEERAYIVKNAYIASRRRERYVEPIDRIIRAAAPPSESDATLIADTESPREVLEALSRSKLEHQILLLVGGVGAGKSTFVDYLKEVALPKDLTATTTWVRVNMNNAPLAADLLYDWLCMRVTAGLRKCHPDVDFDSLKVIEKIYAVELQRLKKGALQLLAPNTEQYNTRLADEIIRLQHDEKLTANAYARHLCAERGRLLIVVLDNCDKRIRDEQLLMFQAAHWLQQEFSCLIMLPLRDETYDNHRNEPPLDTAIKDLVFRIEPPLFQQVLTRRVSLALKEMTGNAVHSYTLPNRMRVQYPASEQAYYLLSILRSIFEYDAFIRRLIVGLAGRDVRKAMEIFLEFCTSGHIGEDQIFKIRQAEGQYTLPYDVVARVLLRLNRRFYDGDHSYVKNLFWCTPEDTRPTYFARLSALRWLQYNFAVKGPSGFAGYHRVDAVKADLVLLGLEEETIQRELLYLLQGSCIIAEHLRTDRLSDDDLIRLAPAGFVHLNLVGNPDYLAAVAEDTWFDRERTAKGIADRIWDRRSHYSAATTYANGMDLLEYLTSKLGEPFPDPDAYLENQNWKYMVDMSHAHRGLQDMACDNPWVTVIHRYAVGHVVKGFVRTVNTYGAFVDIEPGLTGLVFIDEVNRLDADALEQLQGSDKFVRIETIEPLRERMRLSFAEAD